MTTCRALVPMDIPVLTIIKQLEQQHVKPDAMASIKATTALISIDGALSILKVFRYAKDTFHLKGQTWLIEDLGSERYFPHLQGRMAYETPVVWFWGGPPTALRWYEGTLQTFLDDRVLHEIRTRGVIEIAKWIGTNLHGVIDD